MGRLAKAAGMTRSVAEKRLNVLVELADACRDRPGRPRAMP
jgi:hypothetical protein